MGTGSNKRTVTVMCEHFDQNESDGNAAKKYILEFSEPVNGSWLLYMLKEFAREHMNFITCDSCEKDVTYHINASKVICTNCLSILID